MKKIHAVAVAAVLMIGVAACGGSGDGGGTTPEVASTAAGTSYQVMTKSYDLMLQLLGQIGGAPAGQVVKATGVPVCNTNGVNSYICTIDDGQGGSATLTGTVDEAAFSYTFNAVFDNFRPEANTLIDGSFLWKFTISENLIDMYSSAKSAFGKSAAAKQDAEDNCDYSEDNVDGEGFCTETATQCTAGAANHLMKFEYTIGADGFTYTDVCGTFVYGPNTSMIMDYCSDNIETTGLFTVQIDGTFNGEAVDESVNALCDYSSLY